MERIKKENSKNNKREEDDQILKKINQVKDLENLVSLYEEFSS